MDFAFLRSSFLNPQRPSLNLDPYSIHLGPTNPVIEEGLRACDIPTQVEGLFLCRTSFSDSIRWNPLVSSNPTDYLRAIQWQALAEASRRGETVLAQDSGPGFLEAGLNWFANGPVGNGLASLGGQIRRMGNGISPPSFDGAPPPFGCTPRRTSGETAVRVPVPSPVSPVVDAARPALPSPMRPLFPGIAMAEFNRTYSTDKTARVVVVRLDLSQIQLSLREMPGRLLEDIFNDPEIDVAINAGFFERDFNEDAGFVLEASGLQVLHGRELSPANPRGGSGVLVVDNGRARLVSFDAIDDSVRRAELALQCGPRLIEADGRVGIYREDNRSNRRTALCLRDGGRTLDFAILYQPEGRGGASLFTLANWLHDGLIPGDRGCESALNLDGGPSTGIHVRNAPGTDLRPVGQVLWALTARARSGSR